MTYSVITKKDYFRAVRAEHPSGLDRMAGDLKHIQDMIMWEALKDSRNISIVEAGGGSSRILTALDRSNSLTNSDEFLGNDGGPGTVTEIPGVKVHREKLGSMTLPAESADVVFSISVIEHITNTAALEAFFTDAYRILKPGGRTVHAIDMYMHETGKTGNETVDNQLAYYRSRVRIIHDAVLKAGFQFVAAPGIDMDRTFFRSDFASNSDLSMLKWDSWGTYFSELRLHSQVCSLFLDAVKPKQVPAETEQNIKSKSQKRRRSS